MATQASDPTYLAMLRALGFEEAEARAGAASQSGAIQARQAFEFPEIAYQGDISRRGISGSMEDRGMFRSGMHDRALAEQRHGEVLQQGRMVMGTTDDLASVEMGLARQLAALRRNQAEQELRLGGSTYLNDQAIPYR